MPGSSSSLLSSFSSRRCAVLGAGVSNLPLVRLLREAGAAIEVRDKRPPEALGEVASALRRLEIPLRAGPHYLENLDSFDVLFRSPGIRPDTPEIARAVARGAVLTSEMEQFFALCPCPIVGITGSDGKTTTTTLTALLLRESGAFPRVFLGGNIGEPLLPRAGEMTARDVAVAELSSFQLMTIHRPATIALLTNLSPNHLDWHRDMREYIEAKTHIYQGEGSHFVLFNAGDERSMQLAKILHESRQGSAELVTFSSRVPADYELRGGIFTRRGKGLFPVERLLLPGLYNAENFLAALAAADSALALAGAPPVSDECAEKVASSFPGVEHRLELVCQVGGVKYYNSSIDSTPTRTAAALSNFSDRDRLIVICGGYDKHLPFAPLASALLSHARRVILTGATASAIADAIRLAEDSQCTQNRVDLRIVPDFDDAVRTAMSLARPGDTVLLSPACASFDAFPNFEARGNRFKEIVRGAQHDDAGN